MSDTIFPKDGMMKPILIIPPDMISKEDVRALRDNQICVVVASDPDAIKFLDPIPSMSQRTEIEAAAIELSRRLLNGHAFASPPERRDICKLYVDILIEGTKLGPQQPEAPARKTRRR